MFGSSRASRSATAELAVAAGRGHDRGRRVERQVLDDVGQEDRRELLAEVDRDPDADPGELAPGERGDREAEGAFLDEGQPAAAQQLGQLAERRRVAEPGRGDAGEPGADDGHDHADRERREQPDAEHDRDRGRTTRSW